MNRITKAPRTQRRLKKAALPSVVFVSSVPFWFIPLSTAQLRPEKREPPRISVATPLGVPIGKTTRVMLRGMRLDTATEVRCHHPTIQVKLLDKQKLPVGQDKMADAAGADSLTIEMTVPADAYPEFVTLSVITSAGESAPHQLAIDDDKLVTEREPNNGFGQAQALTLPAHISGAIQAPQDVDVFRFEGRAGQHITCEVLADRLGSPLDAALTLYDAAGVALSTADDSPGSRDPILKCTLPKAGIYFLAVIDADDRGGPTHVYRLLIRSEP